MGQVIRISEFLELSASRRAASPPPEPGSRYYCTRCGADHFLLSVSGTVICEKCKAVMRNLRISPDPQAQEQV